MSSVADVVGLRRMPLDLLTRLRPIAGTPDRVDAAHPEKILHR